MKTAGRKTQTAGPTCPVTEHMARQIRTDHARSSGLGSKKTSGLRECVFS
jgi:hypothetical protein